MNRPTVGSTSRMFLVVLAIMVAAMIVVGPGLLVWSRMHGIYSWRLFFPLGFMSLLNLGLAIWVGIDAQRRCGQGILWGLLVFFTSIIGLVVYLLVCPTIERKAAVAEAASPSCPSCSRKIEPTFKLCPYCGERLGGTCPGCGRPVRAGWKVCPECGKPLGT